MENKRFLKKFENQSTYESQKDEVMGMPYVVLLEDTKEVVYVSENNEIDYASQPFTLVALEDGTMDIAMPSGATFMNYSLNDGDWVENTEDIVLEVKANDKVKLKGNADAVIGDGYGYKIFDLSMPVNVEGNIMSLLYGNDFEDKKTLKGDGCFYYCFFDTNIVSAKNLILPATTLTIECYYYMFCRCTNLVEAPQLPATTLADRCYNRMFFYCTSLTEAPELPATTLASGCYSHMFCDCTSLTEAPELPATTLASGCYSSMFYNTNVLPDCSNIDFASEAVVASGGLQGLFGGTKVTDADLERILPKNSNGKYCLPATTLASNCYDYMFRDCTSLTTAPVLPATTLANHSYNGMFYGCSSLTEAPALPATTLAICCYQYMFSYCTSLVEAPKLPATKLTERCYQWMFEGCSNLNKITMLATNISAFSCLSGWVKGVASSGTFVKNATMTSLPTATSSNSYSGIPNGWTVQNY